jgi:YaeC family lipoprotein
MPNVNLSPLLHATWQTIYMVFLSSFIGILGGLCVGVLLFLTRPKGLKPRPQFYRVLSIIVNIVRSVPFIILMISIIPFTRFVVGTSIGINAAIVPLAIAAIPYYARISESAFLEIPAGLLETAKAIGANIWQTVCKILIPEALPALIKGGTLTVIGLIGYSAIAGAVGAGGLGELAIDYGYQQFNLLVMVETVVLLVVLVQFIQTAGDFLADKRRVKPIVIGSLVLWVLCLFSQAWPTHASSLQTLKVGVMTGVDEKIMHIAQNVAKKRYDLNIDVIPFSDYVLPNESLNDGEIDANIFQHVPYLNAQIKSRGYKLTPIAKTFVYPMGFYSKKIHQLSQLPDGAVVAIPNDPSNEGRALRLLQINGLIRLKPGVGIFGTLRDVIANPQHLQLKTLSDAQLPRVFKDAALVALTDDYVGVAGLTVNQAILKEGPNAPYANVIVVQAKNKNKLIYQKLIDAMHSPEVVKATLKAFPHGAAIKAWH